MSIFQNIWNKITGHHGDVASVSAQINPGAGTAPQPQPGQQPTVDVDAILSDMAAKKGQPSNWRESIVDLLKLLDMDSSLEARKALAHELGYTGSTDDSATMNVWLIKEVRQKLAQNGGKMPM